MRVAERACLVASRVNGTGNHGPEIIGGTEQYMCGNKPNDSEFCVTKKAVKESTFITTTNSLVHSN